MKTKKCSKCGKVKPATLKFFNSDKRLDPPLTSSCKTCHNSYMNRFNSFPRIRDKVKKRYIHRKKTGFFGQCVDCGVNLASKRSKRCWECSVVNVSGPKSPNWKGGKRVDSKGYVLLYRPDHPYTSKSCYVYKHRLVMEKHLGRYLRPDETVHHKNGIRDDNRIENLELRVGNHGSGGTVPDLIVWAKALLSTYGTDERMCA